MNEETGCTMFACPPKCTGTEHDFSGPVVEFAFGDGTVSSVTCVHCGADQFSRDMMMLP